MIEVTEKELEDLVEKVIKNEIKRTELLSILHTDLRTLYARIYNMENTDLLKRYLEQYPYKPKENKNINYRNLIIELIKNNKRVLDMQKEYEIAERTYRRNIEKIKLQDSKLYNIYKNYIRGNMQDEEMEYIMQLSSGKVCNTKKSEEEREAKLLDIFATYNILKEKGMPEDEILLEIKETRKSLKRKGDELYRLQKSEQFKNETFKERIKVENTPRPSNNQEDIKQCKRVEEKINNKEEK